MCTRLYDSSGAGIEIGIGIEQYYVFVMLVALVCA
jgi:hypothetical protein